MVKYLYSTVKDADVEADAEADFDAGVDAGVEVDVASHRDVDQHERSPEKMSLRHNHDGDGVATTTAFLDHVIWRAFTLVFAFVCVMFGAYTTSFYLRTLIRNRLDAWDIINPGIYHSDRWDSNTAMSLHFVGGAYMMVLGPLQFIKAIRRHYIDFHRWNGRLTVTGITLAASGGMYYTCAVGTTVAHKSGNVVNVANVLFAASFLLCVAQIYRHARWTKQIQLHKLWAYRIAALCFGNIFARLSVLLVCAVFGQDAEALRAAMSGLDAILFVPFLLLADQLWRREQQQQQQQEEGSFDASIVNHPSDPASPSSSLSSRSLLTSMLLLTIVSLKFILLTLFIVSALMQVWIHWMPYLAAPLDADSSDQEDDIDDAHH